MHLLRVDALILAILICCQCSPQNSNSNSTLSSEKSQQDEGGSDLQSQPNIPQLSSSEFIQWYQPSQMEAPRVVSVFRVNTEEIYEINIERLGAVGGVYRVYDSSKITNYFNFYYSNFDRLGCGAEHREIEQNYGFLICQTDSVDIASTNTKVVQLGQEGYLHLLQIYRRHSRIIGAIYNRCEYLVPVGQIDDPGTTLCSISGMMWNVYLTTGSVSFDGRETPDSLVELNKSVSVFLLDQLSSVLLDSEED